ncbi:hypothetical protein BN946_scf185012.g6 [Trametes cinnabarina]|uniref:Uncharacterized protein n=1 Tax=Pycnoporus cinnabarinus TaxID=5643 RepID=A0A060ST55_PYCCI|nr:hypothetical protein BN946_scf185012.g6 [Trametes cinnabarina]
MGALPVKRSFFLWALLKRSPPDITRTYFPTLLGPHTASSILSVVSLGKEWTHLQRAPCTGRGSDPSQACLETGHVHALVTPATLTQDSGFGQHVGRSLCKKETAIAFEREYEYSRTY